MRWFVIRAALIVLGIVGSIALGGSPALATYQGQNGKIAFWMDRGHGAEIYTISRDGTGLRRLTHVDGSTLNPDWSPDGRRIVYWLEGQGLWIIRADGSHPHEVTPYGGPVSFTPDGHHLVYENCRRRCGIFLMRADGSDAPGTRLTSNPFHGETDEGPEVSPDGRTVTFVRKKVDDLRHALFSVSIDGRGLTQLTTYALEVSPKHDWAPDGSHLLITQYADHPRGHTPNLATIRRDGSGRFQLTNQDGADVAALAGSFSPDGRWVIFRLEDQSKGRYSLWKIHPDGTGRTRIGRFKFAPRSIDWGPRPS
jgi:Tol biopolymer transport system component